MRLALLGAYLLTAGSLGFATFAFALDGTAVRLLGFAISATLAIVGGRLYGNPWTATTTPITKTWSPRRRTVFLITAILTPAGAFATIISGLFADGLTAIVVVFLILTAISFATFLIVPLRLQRQEARTGT